MGVNNKEEPTPRFNKDIKYIVKPEEGIVVGIYNCPYNKLWDSLASGLDFNQQIAVRGLVDFYLDDVVTIRATAKCSGNDVFDEAYGKKLVEAKIYKKLYRKFCREIEKLDVDLTIINVQVYRMYYKYRAKLASINQDIDNYFMKE